MAGIVVDHKETGVRFAISEENFNSKVHQKVRDLKPGETILGFKPKAREGIAPAESRTQTEGSSHEGTKDAK